MWPGKKYWQKFDYLQVVDIVSCLSRTKFIFHKCFHISSMPFRLSRLYTSETFHKGQKLSMEYLNNTHTHAVSPLSTNTKYYSKTLLYSIKRICFCHHNKPGDTIACNNLIWATLQNMSNLKSARIITCQTKIDISDIGRDLKNHRESWLHE